MQGSSPPTLFVVFADPPREREQEFHDWYDTVHGPDVIENGSFEALYRYRAVGPGRSPAPYLALWEGCYAAEAELWDFVRPRERELADAGRMGGVSSETCALVVVHHSSRITPTSFVPRVLTTVQNDWRQPGAATSPLQWWRDCRLDDAPNGGGNSWLYSSDPEGRGAGYHLALFETHDALPAVQAAWAGRGAAGASPVPRPAADPWPEPVPARAWIMHWEPVARLRPTSRPL